MGRYLGSWPIDQVLRVHKQVSSVTTGAATDGDAVPTWRVYEDDTATPITTGSFATLNAQIGFYVANITLTAAIGYEAGRTYAVRSQVTVAAIIGADVDTFQIQAVVSAVTVGATAASAIAAAVWDKTAAAHNGVGSFGEIVNDTESLGAIVSGIWDEPKANHTTADTYGEFLDATVSGVSGGDTTVGATAAAAIAVAVWGATRAANAGAGTFGEGVASVVGAVTVGATAASAIAVAVGAVTIGATAQAAIVDLIWDEPKAGHTTADTYGEYLDATLSAKASQTSVDAVAATAAAIQAQTGQLAFNTAGAVASNVTHVINDPVQEAGASDTSWGGTP